MAAQAPSRVQPNRSLKRPYAALDAAIADSVDLTMCVHPPLPRQSSWRLLPPSAPLAPLCEAGSSLR